MHLYVKLISLIGVQIKSHFHVKWWTPRLALKMRLKVIVKWPIDHTCYVVMWRHSWQVIIRPHPLHPLPPPPPKKINTWHTTKLFLILSRKYFLVGWDRNLRINKKLRKGRGEEDQSNDHTRNLNDHQLFHHSQLHEMVVKVKVPRHLWRCKMTQEVRADLDVPAVLLAPLLRDLPCRPKKKDNME